MVLEGEILVGRYRVIRELGSGGMGTVYLAEHVHLGRPTAVKLLRAELSSDSEAEARFRREALLAAKLMHPAVAQIFDFDRTEDGRFLIAMEYVEGETLAQRLGREGPFPLTMALQILNGLADGLDRAHALGIVHRDIKPENVMLAAGGAVKLLDFGVARDVASTSSMSLTSAGIAVGTPAYMSPEQLVGESPTSTSDIYALGTVVFEMLTGRQPHSGATFAEFRMRRLIHAPPPLHMLRSELPPALSAIVARALEIDPLARWSTAGAFARAAANVLDAAPVSVLVSASSMASEADVTQPQWMESQFEALRLAGRDREARVVRDAWAATRGGRTTVLWIEGEEGAGKSIFFRLAQREAAVDGAVSLVGRGYQFEAAAPYGPWLPLLRSALALRAGKEREWPAIAALTNARLVTPAPERSALYDEISLLFAAAAARGPLFVGIDDLDWCDPASVSLFEYLAHSLGDAPILLASSVTLDGTGGTAHKLELGRTTRERLRRLDRAAWVRLQPLGVEPVRAWLGRALGHDAPDELLRFVYGHTEGNVFFIEQVVRSLIERGSLERMSSESARTAFADYPPPEAVADVVQRRLSGMSENARDLLQTAAVAGREFDVDILLAVSTHTEDAVLDVLDEAAAAGIVEPVTGVGTDRYRFTQAKIAQVLSQSMNMRRRRKLHGRIAEALSLRGEDAAPAGALAWHWFRAGELPRASVAACAAAQKALALHAYDDALTYGAMAAEAASTPTERREAHELRGDALRRLDRESEAADAFAQARIAVIRGSSEASDNENAQSDDNVVSALRRKELRSALRATTIDATIVTTEARKLLDGADVRPPVLQCALEILFAEALLAAHDSDASVEAARRAREWAREAGDAGQMADALLVLGNGLLRAQRLGESGEIALEACAVCETLRDPYIAARAALLKGAVAAAQQDVPTALVSYAEAMRHAERAQAPRLVRQIRDRREALPAPSTPTVIARLPIDGQLGQ